MTDVGPRTTTPRDTNLEDKGCPWCDAAPGEACTTPDGKPRNDHEAREYVLPEQATPPSSLNAALHERSL